MKRLPRALHVLFLLAATATASRAGEPEGDEFRRDKENYGNWIEEEPGVELLEAPPALTARLDGAGEAVIRMIGAVSLENGALRFEPILVHHHAVERWTLLDRTGTLATRLERDEACHAKLKGKRILTKHLVPNGEAPNGYHVRAYAFEVEEVLWVKTRTQMAQLIQEKGMAGAMVERAMRAERYADALKALERFRALDTDFPNGALWEPPAGRPGRRLPFKSLWHGDDALATVKTLLALQEGLPAGREQAAFYLDAIRRLLQHRFHFKFADAVKARVLDSLPSATKEVAAELESGLLAFVREENAKDRFAPVRCLGAAEFLAPVGGKASLDFLEQAWKDWIEPGGMNDTVKAKYRAYIDAVKARAGEKE